MKTVIITAALFFLATSVFASSCPRCSATVRENWKLCPQCAGKLVKSPPLLKCPGCGEKLEGDWKVCPACGRRLREENPPAGETKMLWDFENLRQFGNWRQFDGLEATQVKEFATSGENAVRVEFPPAPDEAPAFRYEGSPVDLRGYGYLKADLHNPGSVPVRVSLKLKSTNHSRHTTLSYDIPPGAGKTISVPIEGIARQVDLGDIFYVNLFHWHPVNGGVYYLDNIRLIK